MCWRAFALIHCFRWYRCACVLAALKNSFRFCMSSTVWAREKERDEALPPPRRAHSPSPTSPYVNTRHASLLPFLLLCSPPRSLPVSVAVSVCVRACVFVARFCVYVCLPFSCMCELACTEGAPHRPASDPYPASPYLSAAPKLHRATMPGAGVSTWRQQNQGSSSRSPYPSHGEEGERGSSEHPDG